MMMSTVDKNLLESTEPLFISPNQPLILVIDDEPAIIEVLEMLLEDDFQVSTCLNPTKALEMAQQLNPKVIVVDFMMPRLNGVQLLHLIRSFPALAKIPVVLMTATANFNQVGINPTELTRLDAVLLRKPFDNTKLISLLKSLCR